VAVAGPWHDGGVLPRDEGAIVAMQIDRHAAERLAPVSDRAVVMRMRDGESPSGHRASGRSRWRQRGQRHAVPHHASHRPPGTSSCALLRSQSPARHQCRQCLDRHARRACGFSQFLAREPGWPLPVHILPLVLADQDTPRRLRAFGKLGTALFAGPIAA
jgi:hypothetical protein